MVSCWRRVNASLQECPKTGKELVGLVGFHMEIVFLVHTPSNLSGTMGLWKVHYFLVATACFRC